MDFKHNNRIKYQPGLFGSATQKSWRGLGSDANAMEQVIARNVRKKSWEAMIMGYYSKTLKFKLIIWMFANAFEWG